MKKNLKKNSCILIQILTGLATILLSSNNVTAMASSFSYEPRKNIEYYIEDSKRLPKENKFLRMIEHGDQQHPSEHHRWQKYVGTQYYWDCKVHRNINCYNPAFIGCWQCREYYMGKDGRVRKIRKYSVTRNGDVIIWDN